VTVTFSKIDSNAAVVEITPESSESPTSSPRPSAMPSASTSPSATPTTVESICNDELFLKIDILTDNYPDETGWKLKAIDGEEIARVDPSTYDMRETNYTVSFIFSTH
jgi:hypothetical protein